MSDIIHPTKIQVYSETYTRTYRIIYWRWLISLNSKTVYYTTSIFLLILWKGNKIKDFFAAVKHWVSTAIDISCGEKTKLTEIGLHLFIAY